MSTGSRKARHNTFAYYRADLLFTPPAVMPTLTAPGAAGARSGRRPILSLLKTGLPAVLAAARPVEHRVSCQ